MADSVFLAGKIIVTAEAQGAASSIQREINSAKSAIDTFNQNSKLIIDIDTKTAARISVMKGNLETITKGLTELKEASTSFQNIEIGIDRLIGSFELLGNTAKEVSELMIQKIRPALNIPDTTVKSVENYAAALRQIANNAGALSIIKKTPAISVSTPKSPTPVPTAILPIPAGTGTGGSSPANISANQQAAEKYRQTLQEVYDNLVKTFLAARGSDQDTFWVKNKVAIVASVKALMDYHKETGNVIAQGKDLEKMIQNLGKEGYLPAEALEKQKRYLADIKKQKDAGFYTEKEYKDLLLEELGSIKNIENVSKNINKIRKELVQDAIKQTNADTKDADAVRKKTIELEKQKFLHDINSVLKSGTPDQINTKIGEVNSRILQLKKSGTVEDEREILNLNAILAKLTEKQQKIKASGDAQSKLNANLKLAEQFLEGNTSKERATAGIELRKLKVRDQELLFMAAKSKWGKEQIDQLQRQLQLQRGVGAMLADELRNWPAMLGRQIMYGIQWTVIFGTIHRIQTLLANSLKLFGEFERGTSKALRTGLTPAQLSGAFTSEANKGIRETVNHYRELLQVQAMVFTSKHQASIEDYMGVVYELTSANMSLSKAMQFADTTMKVSIAAEGNMRETARTMAGMYNIYGKSIKGAYTEKEKFNQIANVVLLTWSREQMELSELNNALKYVAASGRAMDIDYRVLITTIGHLNTQMVRGATAGTGLRQMMAQTSKDVGGIKESFSSFSDVLVKYSQQEKMAFDPQKPMDFINVLSVMRKNLLKGRKDFVDYGQDIVFTASELSEAYKIMSLRGANVGLTLLRTLPELKKKLEETLNLTGDYIDNFIKMQEMNIPTQWGIMVKNLTMLPAAFLLGATHTQSIAEAMQNINDTMGNIIVGAFVAGKVISGWADYLSKATEKFDKFLMYIDSLNNATGNFSPIASSPLGVISNLYSSGKKDIAGKQAEVDNPEQFIKNIQTSAGELLKYMGVTKEAQKQSDQSFDLGSKKFLKNLEERITNTNIETESWIKKGDYVAAATSSLRGYTQIYKELDRAYDVDKMGKVGKEFEKQTKYIKGLNEAMTGQIQTYMKMKTESANQLTWTGFKGVMDTNIAEREKIDAGEAEKIKRVEELQRKSRELDEYSNLTSIDRSGNVRHEKYLPHIQKEVDDLYKLRREYETVQEDIKNEQKKARDAYYKREGITARRPDLDAEADKQSKVLPKLMEQRNDLWFKLPAGKGSTIADIDKFDVRQFTQDNMDKINKRQADGIATSKAKLAKELAKPENEISPDHFALIKDKDIRGRLDTQEKKYEFFHKKFVEESDPKVKKIYKEWMDDVNNNILKILGESPQYMSLLAGVLSGEKEGDAYLAKYKKTLDEKLGKLGEIFKNSRDELFKQMGMPGLNKDQKETWLLKYNQKSELDAIDAAIKEKEYDMHLTRADINAFSAAPGVENNLKLAQSKGILGKQAEDLAAVNKMRIDAIIDQGVTETNLQLDQKKRFDALFLTEDGKKREAIKENYRKLMDEYRGDDEKIRQLQRQQNKELADLAVEQANNYIKERQRALDEVKKIKEEEIKHAQKMADQALEIEKQKNLDMVKAAALAEIERLKATGKATPESVKKIMEKMDASVEAMTGKYDIKGEELKRSQAEQDKATEYGKIADYQKRYNEEKARMEKADKALKKLKLSPEEEINTQQYKDREEARKNANEARENIKKSLEAINQADVDIQTSLAKETDIKVKQEEKIWTETDARKKNILKEAYGVTPSVIPGMSGSTSTNNRSVPSSIYSGNLMQQYKEWQSWGGKGSFADFLKTLSPDTSPLSPSVRPGTSGGGSGTVPVTTGTGGGTSSVDVFNKFKEMQNPWVNDKEEISLGRLKTARESRLEQLRKEIALMGKIGELQKFGVDMELGSFKGVGKVPGSIGQSFARILANQVPVPKLAGDLFSKDKALSQIDAAIKAKEQGGGGLDAGSKGGVEINITIGDNSNPSKLPGHIENNLTMIGKQITEHFENLGVG